MNKNQIVKFRDFASVNAGQSPKSEYYSKNEGIPFLQGNRTFGRLYPEIDTYTKKVTKIAQKGDILMSVRAPVGDLNFAKEKVCIGRGLAAISAKDNNNKFLFYCLMYNIENLIKQSGGTTYNSVNKDIINDFDLVMPITLDERLRVANILSTIDKKIELNNQINSELESMAKLIYDYWFVQFDFPDENGKPYKSSGGKMIYNEELKREIPEGWEAKYLDDVLNELTKGITTKYVEKSSLINLNQKVNKGFKLDRQYFKYLDESIEVSSSKYAKVKDILINSLGQGTVGRIHYYCEKNDNVVVDQHLFILRTDNSKITSTYLYQLLNSKAYQLQVQRQITGSTGMQMLNASDLKTLKFVVPKMGLLNEFESLVYPLFEKAVLNEKESQKLAELRDWLLPMLMNGQVTVN